MKQYQLYARLHEVDQWSYCGTFNEAATAFKGILMARARGCAAKVVTSARGVVATQDVLAEAR